jgi:hypothetical protein
VTIGEGLARHIMGSGGRAGADSRLRGDAVEKVCGEDVCSSVSVHAPVTISMRLLLRRSSHHPAGERLEVLGDSGKMELIACTCEASQAQAIEAVVGFQMSKAHLDLPPRVA